jgi:SAM-dependent methyltransferase
MTETYDRTYFETSCGRPYRRDEHWLEFFGGIADRIVEDLSPATVLDAGCAMGFLVEALRDRGVDAHGIDISEYALAQVREDVAPHVRRASLTEPLDRQYDLIVCIEVLEHLQPEEARAALDNLCAHADELLLSSTPSDFREPTHVNVRPTSDWVAELARRGFLADAGYDASYVTPWARRFRRRGFPVWQALEAYERRVSRAEEETGTLRAELERERRLRAEATTPPRRRRFRL